MKYFYLSLKIIKSVFITTILFIVSCGLLACLLQLPFIHGCYEFLESLIYFQIFTSSAQPNEHLVIIDEGDNIFDRVTYAKLISGLNRLGAKVIAMDVLFDQHKTPVEDAALANTTQAASDKLIHAMEFLSFNNHVIIPDRFHFKTSEKPSSNRFIKGVYGTTLPFDDLLEVTKYLGHVNSSSDIARRDEKYFPLIIHFNDHFYPSLPLLAVMKFINCNLDSIPHFRDDMIELKGNSEILEIPIDNRTQTLINFIVPAKFSGKIFTFEEALDCINENNMIFKNKIILIGNSRDSQEQMYGPHFQSYPNLIIFGSLISQILNNENIREGILESLFAGFLLVTLGIVEWIFLSDKYKRFKLCYVYIYTFLILLIFAAISLKLRTKTYVVIPYLAFCITYLLSKEIISPIKKVFISYSHHDIDFARKLKKSLKARGIEIIIDENNLRPGEDIKDYILRSIKKSDVVISIISKNSLESPFVIIELMETLKNEKITQKKKLVPIYIDKYFLDKSYQLVLYEVIDEKIDTLVQEISDISKKHKYIEINDLNNNKNIYIDLRNNLDKVLTKLNVSSVVDFSSDDKLKKNLLRLVKEINIINRY